MLWDGVGQRIQGWERGCQGDHVGKGIESKEDHDGDDVAHQ